MHTPLHAHPARAQRIVLCLLALISLLSLLPAGTVAAAEPQMPMAYPLQGTVLVTLPNAVVEPAAGALVAAFQPMGHTGSLVDPLTGKYGLYLVSGAWEVTILPPKPSTISPKWVYRGDRKPVLIDADPLTTQTLNFQVDPAPGTLQGQLVAPADATVKTFDALNHTRAWVQAANEEGEGNLVEVGADGNFSVRVLVGNTHLRVQLENPAWAAPAGLSDKQWYVDLDTPVDAGLIQLDLRNDSISGNVIDVSTGAPVPDTFPPVPVRAVRLDGSESVVTSSLTDGSYLLKVGPGVWAVQAQPQPGSPLYLPAEPPQKVVVVSGNYTQDVKIAKADRLIHGRLVVNGAPVGGVRGMAVALYDASGSGTWLQVGPSVPVTDVLGKSVFTLPVSSLVASVYRIKLMLMPGSGYTQASPVSVDLSADSSNPLLVDVPLSGRNSKIQGHLLNLATGQPALGVPGMVAAAGNTGAFAASKVDPLSAAYVLNVTTTDTAGGGGTYWWVHAFVDPMSGYVVTQPRTQKVFLPYNNGAGSTATADFKVARLDARITGKVTGPEGKPLPGVRVSASAADGGYQTWALTDLNGLYVLRVPAGKYMLRAEARFPIPLFAPKPVTVNAPASGSVTADLQFRAWDNTTIAGTVRYDGAAHVALVRAFSDSGARASALTGADGLYTLKVLGGETWHVQAVSREGSDFLASERASVDTVAGAVSALDLTLQKREVLPNLEVFNFDASEDQTLTLSNGAQVGIPAGAMAETGQVTVTAHPLPELADDGGAQPVSFGYRLQAFDADHLPITHFNEPVTLRIPFTAEQLRALGVKPEQLIPCYWDPATESWKPLPNYTVEVNADGSGLVIVSVNHFTDFANVVENLPYKVRLPMMGR